MNSNSGNQMNIAHVNPVGKVIDKVINNLHQYEIIENYFLIIEYYYKNKMLWE
jgi:hypothetical protein